MTDITFIQKWQQIDVLTTIYVFKNRLRFTLDSHGIQFTLLLPSIISPPNFKPLLLLLLLSIVKNILFNKNNVFIDHFSRFFATHL